MELDNLNSVYTAFDLDPLSYTCSPHGSGLINKSYLLENIQEEKRYILQKINTQVFKNPQIIANNIKLAADYISDKHPDYYFFHFIKTKDNQDYYLDSYNNYWRLITFV